MIHVSGMDLRPGEELGDGILIVQLRMGRDELAVGGGKDDGYQA